MVYVIQNSLTITPVDPYDNESLTATAWIRADPFPINLWCDDLGGSWTKTNIHLLRRNVTSGQTWANADQVATYDCTGQCCLDTHTLAWAPDGGQGWLIHFDTLNPLHVTSGNSTTYEFMAVDQGDLVGKDATRIAKKTVIVSRDPYCIDNPCITTCNPTCETCPTMSGCAECATNPCANQCAKKPCSVCPSQIGCTGSGTTCAPTDYVCQIIDYAKKNPLVVVAGVVVLYLLMSPPRRSK